MNNDNLIPIGLTAAAVRSYIDFDGHCEHHTDAVSSQASLQSEGVAAIWHLLETKSFAYLADEVGMGKTRQAMGVIATQFLRNPDARIVVVCSNETLQRQWQSEWSEFLRTCYRLEDDRLLSSIDAAPLEQLHLHGNLDGFVEALRRNEDRIHLLRYSSFSRPLRFDGKNIPGIINEYLKKIGESSEAKLNAEEHAAFELCSRASSSDRVSELCHALAVPYCRRIGALMTEGVRMDEQGSLLPRNAIDLLIFDEAQYLRHTGNFRNRHIAAAFQRNAQRWLFMSATPLHSSPQDIYSLDTYLCRKHAAADSAAIKIPDDCADCEHASRCSRMSFRLGAMAKKRQDVVNLLPSMMVRRTRAYLDKEKKRYSKVLYRKYERVRYTGSDDPFLALTMALVQKRLVGALAGKGNRFRLGECASFESLSTSVGRTIGHLKPAQKVEQITKEYEAAPDRKRDTQKDEANVALDRTVIDDLNQSFVMSMGGLGSASDGIMSPQTLPHAKLDQSAEQIFKQSLANGSHRKVLVFVRRIDTVEEMRDKLHGMFQMDIDNRISSWRTILAARTDEMKIKSLWEERQFWGSGNSDEEIDEEVLFEEARSARESTDVEEDEDHPAPPPLRSSFRNALHLPYFDALRRDSGDGEHHHGKFVSFSSRLLSRDPSRNLLDGFLLQRPLEEKVQATGTHDTQRRKNHSRWERMLVIVLGQPRVDILRATLSHAWLFDTMAADTPDAWKLASLQLCLLQSMRQTDFIVDLYIMHMHVKSVDGEHEQLAEKLLWFLDSGANFDSSTLEIYVQNWKEKLQRWIEHFDLIVNKCLRSGPEMDWREICGKPIHEAFRLMSPAIGRSSRLRNHNAVTQFKLPVHPNVLICTDVLKEGVDMHLFCDNVEHYGVAWTSGDLEQRIGRVDRIGSMIARSIEHYDSSQQDAASNAPQLRVAFPYLDGTLDRHQVDRVILAKLASDLRMDLGKTKEEIGEMSLGSLDAEYSLSLATTDQDERSIVFFPEDAKFVLEDVQGTSLALPEGMRLKRTGLTGPLSKSANTTATDSCTYLAAFDCVRVRRVVAGDGIAARRAIAHGTGAVRLALASSGQMLGMEEVLVAGKLANAASVTAELDEAGPGGVHAPQKGGFKYDDELHTLVCRVDVSFLFSEVKERDIKVLLESIGSSFWLLRAPIGATEAIRASYDGRAWPHWLAKLNSERRWGYLMEDAGTIWFAVVVARANGEEWPLIEHLAHLAGKLALYYRGRSASLAQSELRPYKSRSAFPSLGALTAAGGVQTRISSHTHRMRHIEKRGFLDMNKGDLALCGSVLAGVGDWFTDVFRSMLVALHAERGQSRDSADLQMNPLQLLDGGLMYLCTEQREHFRLQAYLDLNATMEGGEVAVGPKLIWELVASPATRGPKPMLRLSRLEELPHKYLEAWDGEAAEECSVHTSRDVRYRHLAFCLPPALWDSASAELISAMQDVLSKMLDLSTFQMKGCRDLLLKTARKSVMSSISH